MILMMWQIAAKSTKYAQDFKFIIYSTTHSVSKTIKDRHT